MDSKMVVTPKHGKHFANRKPTSRKHFIELCCIAILTTTLLAGVSLSVLADPIWGGNFGYPAESEEGKTHQVSVDPPIITPPPISSIDINYPYTEYDHSRSMNYVPDPNELMWIDDPFDLYYMVPVETPEPTATPEPTPEPVPDSINNYIGLESFQFGNSTFKKYALPSAYYGNAYDWSYFQPFESCWGITNPDSTAYQVTHSINAYIDANGFMRYALREDQFSVDGKDDYVVALGTYYKPRGTCGTRYLVVTTTGMFTMITGDERADSATDSMHMFTVCGPGYSCGAIIEYLIDPSTLEDAIWNAGTCTAGSVEAMHGEILYIYGIE